MTFKRGLFFRVSVRSIFHHYLKNVKSPFVHNRKKQQFTQSLTFSLVCNTIWAREVMVTFAARSVFYDL